MLVMKLTYTCSSTSPLNETNLTVYFFELSQLLDVRLNNNQQSIHILKTQKVAAIEDKGRFELQL